MAVETQQWRNVSWNLNGVSEKDKIRRNPLAMTGLCSASKATARLEVVILKIGIL